ncbi:MAG: histidine--tRNA ligase family protein [Dehalococcoidales bacterium]|nr:histidine--tRNA ligase family protein [Dehalococcoidales bacterium]
MRIQRCKGTQDLTPGEMRKFRYIEGIFRDCCSRWGYSEVRTPTLEYLHLFTSTGTLTPGRLSKVYSFLDWDGWSGERVVMRPDGTIPIARMYIDTVEDNRPAKLFYVTNVFIFEETGKETREKWQCGVERIGAGSILADVELISIALEVLKKAGIRNPQLRLSHAGLIRALLDKFGLEREEREKAFDDILDGDEKVLARIKSENPELSRILTPLLDLKGKSSGFLKNVQALIGPDMPELEASLDNFVSVVEMLEQAGIKYRIDISSGRGFEYYTGITWQIVSGGEHIGGGGRYDALIPLMGGDDIPASGFALYLDKLMERVKPDTETDGIRVLIKAGEGELLKESFGLVEYLHDAGYSTVIGSDTLDRENPNRVIEVSGGENRFTVTDTRTGKKIQANTRSEVLQYLEAPNDE